MQLRQLTTALVVATTASCVFFGGSANAGGTCTNTDYQVVVYRYAGSNCAGEETVAYYQSGGAIREGTGSSATHYKQFTCCDDGQKVTLYSSASNNYTDLADDECLSGTAAETVQKTTDEVRTCVRRPPDCCVYRENLWCLPLRVCGARFVFLPTITDV